MDGVQHVLQPAVEGQVQRHPLFEGNEGTVAASLTILHAQLKVGAEYDQLWASWGGSVWVGSQLAESTWEEAG